MTISEEKFRLWWANKKELVHIAWPDSAQTIENLARGAFDAGFWSASQNDFVDDRLGAKLAEATLHPMDNVKLTVVVHDSSLVNR